MPAGGRGGRVGGAAIARRVKAGASCRRRGGGGVAGPYRHCRVLCTRGLPAKGVGLVEHGVHAQDVPWLQRGSAGATRSSLLPLCSTCCHHFLQASILSTGGFLHALNVHICGQEANHGAPASSKHRGRALSAWQQCWKLSGAAACRGDAPPAHSSSPSTAATGSNAIIPAINQSMLQRNGGA